MSPGSLPPATAPADFDRELDLATDAARRTGALQMERYGRLERIVHKSEKDVVTEVDHLSEELILEAIRGAFPQDGILAEESGSHRGARRHVEAAAAAEPSGAPEPARRTWVVDPLDGTVNYANGIPIFCVSIALVRGHEPVVGVVYDPARDELFSAVAGQGACLDGQPIHLPVKEKLSDCVISLALPWRGFARRERRIRRDVRVTRNLGSAALALAYVGNGRFDAFLQLRGLSSWDIAAAGLIAAEGGARVTDASSGPWLDLDRPGRALSVVAAAPTHHQALLAALA